MRTRGRARRSLLLFAPLLLAGDCEVGSLETECDEDGEYAITLEGSGWADHTDLWLHYRIYQGTDEFIQASGSTPIPGDTFTHEFGCVLTANETYTLALYLDSDADGICDDSGRDQAWLIDLGAAKGDLTETITPGSSTNAEACDLF